jgi:hypothetical protein
VNQAEEQVKFLEVRNGMGSLKPIVYLQGYCPESTVERVRQSASQHGWGLIIEEPGPDDAVPTLLENPAWVKPIKAVFDFIGVVPGYREVDISTVFLIFFSLFFALRWAMPDMASFSSTHDMAGKKPQAPAISLLFADHNAVATFVWGFMTVPIRDSINFPRHLKNLKVNWLIDQNNPHGAVFPDRSDPVEHRSSLECLGIISAAAGLGQIGWLVHPGPCFSPPEPWCWDVRSHPSCWAYWLSEWC